MISFNKLNITLLWITILVIIGVTLVLWSCIFFSDVISHQCFVWKRNIRCIKSPIFKGKSNCTLSLESSNNKIFKGKSNCTPSLKNSNKKIVMSPLSYDYKSGIKDGIITPLSYKHRLLSYKHRPRSLTV